MTAEMREAMGAAGVRAAEAIGYSGAGTVEFIVDGSDGLRTDGFWFMEMNTRLQVEHPVTEAITGVDLVEWQLRVASGEALPAAQEDLTINGHSFEARLYAEDVPKGFLPATGTLTHLKFQEGARADSGVRAGDTISPFYDPMIAKLVTHGPTRATALAQMEQALAMTEVAGSVTNLGFLRALTRHEGFKAGEVDTGLIDRNLETLAVDPVPCSRARSLAALGFAGLDQAAGDMVGFALWSAVAQTIQFRFREEEIAARVTTLSPTEFNVAIEDAEHRVERVGDGWRVDDAKVPARVVQLGDAVSVFWSNGYHFERIDPLDRDAHASGDGNLIEAPMPGLVKAVYVKAGAVVAKGDRLAVLEAMKMEHALLAARDGTVAEVLAEAGAQVEAGAALIRLEDAEEAAA